MRWRLPGRVIGCAMLIVAVPILCITILLLPEARGQVSPESEKLQSDVVPQILAWRASNADMLSLGTLEGLKNFDHVCYVWEYQDLGRIEAEVGPIDDYFSEYANSHVPENNVAFIGVRGKSAHVVRIRTKGFSIGRADMKNCAPVRSAILTKDPTSTDSHVLMLLIDRRQAPSGYQSL